MPVTFQKADRELCQNVQQVMKTYHAGLHDAEVTVDVLLAYGPVDRAGEITGPAIKRHGHPCLGQIRVLPLKDRVAGRADAEMVLDGDHVDEWPYEQLLAIIDHELTHLELQVNDHGLVKRDDQDRPMLRLREHDHEFGWFDSVAQRHGACAVEVQQATQLLEQDELRQLYLPGMETEPAA